MFEFQEEADELLQQIIPHLSEFSHLSGGEGKVYFVDDNFVVKKFFSCEVDSALKQQNLLRHAAEVNKLSMEGYCVPRIYAVSLPERDRSNAYFLEERAAGKSLFPAFQFENKVDEFYRKRKARLQQQLISMFKSDFLTVNEQIEALPDSEIEKFILTDYLMTRDFEHGLPDVINSNVLFDGSHLTHVDSYFTKGEVFPKSNSPAEDVLDDMIDLFYDNNPAQSYYRARCGQTPEMEKMFSKNEEVLEEVLRKFIDKTNRLLSPNLRDKKMKYKQIAYTIQDILGSRDASKIIGMIEKE